MNIWANCDNCKHYGDRKRCPGCLATRPPSLWEPDESHQIHHATPKLYTRHEVACIIAELFGDNCACNFNDINEWLPEKCELLDVCPDTIGVACWEQYLKYREEPNG